MKVCVKKIYCNKCQKLVHCREQAANGTMRIMCDRCGSLLRTWDGLRWKFIANQV